MRYGLFGGTFDPVHIGHLISAEFLAERLYLDRVIFIPARIPPHKSNLRITSAEDRVNMLRLATADNPIFWISTYELEKEGPSYTIDTVKYFKSRSSEDEFILLIGADSLSELPDWHRFQELVELIEIKAAYRGGFDPQGVLGRLRMRVSDDVFCKLKDSLVPTPTIEISASQIRQRVRSGLSIKYMVREAVEEYIYRKGLYKDV